MAKQLVRSTSVFSAMTLISRVLGFVRDMVIARYFGASGMTDAFFVAFKIPNFMRRLFAEGAFSQAFVPVLADYKQTKSSRELKQFIDHIAGTLSLILFVITVIGILVAPFLIRIFTPGFSNHGMRYDLAVHMLRITFPYLLFISLTAFAGGILNTHQRFAAPAFTPVLLNISMIIAVIFFARYFTHPITVLAWGVFFGGLLQLLFQYPFLRRIRLLPVFRWGWHDAGVQRVFKLILPAIFGVSVVQIGLLVDTIFASFLPKGSISWLYNSERLMMFPLGVFGVAIATVVLPHLAKRFADGDEREYSHTMNWAIQMVLLVAIPAMIGLVLLSGALLTTLFNYGAFSQHDVMMARQSLIAYACGVPFMMLVKVLVSGFYARQDIKTPVKIALVALMVNIVFNALLIHTLKHAGLALASSIAALVNSALIFILLIKKNILRLDRSWLLFMLRILLGNAVLVALLWWLTPRLPQWFLWSGAQRLLHLLYVVGIPALAYLGTLWILGFRVKRS